MGEFRSLAVGILGGLLVLGIQRLWHLYHQKTIKGDIEFLQWERRHLEEMKKSGLEMNRSGFRSIFALFFLVSLAHVAQFSSSMLFDGEASQYSGAIALFFWSGTLGLSMKLFKRYSDLKNFSEALKRIDAKLEKLNKKAPAN